MMNQKTKKLFEKKYNKIGFEIKKRSEIELDFKKKDIYERIKDYPNLTSISLNRDKSKLKDLTNKLIKRE